MKQSVLIIFCLFLLSACSAYNRIQTSEENGLKTMRLTQSLKSSFAEANTDLTKPSALKVNVDYLYKEKTPQRPAVTIDFKLDKAVNILPDSVHFIILNGESIQLFSVNGQVIIPENLWVPIVHTQNIRYKLNTTQGVLVIELNEKQRSQLTEFFHQAIKHRDEIFPAIPPGQKKW